MMGDDGNDNAQLSLFCCWEHDECETPHTHISSAPFVSELSYNEQQRKSIKLPLLIRSILPPSSISSPHPIHVLQIIFVSLSTKGKFYEIEHSNVPQLFNAKTGKGGQSGQSKKQLNSDCVHRISSIIHDDAALPISLRYISKHSSGFMHNSYIPGKRRKEEKKASSDETASERVSESVIVVWSGNYDLFTLSEILAYLADALNLI